MRVSRMSVSVAAAFGLAAVLVLSQSCGKKSDTSGSSPTTPSSGGGSASISGTVTDATSGAPIASATVAVQGKTTTTGADGKYSFSGLTPASDTLTSKHQGHRNFSQSVTLSGSSTVNVQMTTAPEADVAGAWSGQWKNNTFGSSGAAAMTAAVDTVAQTFQSTMALGGSVFGQGTPPAQDVTFNYNPAGSTFNGTSSFFGNVTATTKPGVATLLPTRVGPFLTASTDISGSMTNVPGGNIVRVDFSGNATSTNINMTYTVVLAAGGTAAGTLVLAKSGGGGSTPPAGSDRYNCPRTGPDATLLANFSVANYNGSTLTQVDLFFTSKDSVGSYTAELTATPKGQSSRTATTGVTIGTLAQSVPASFVFSPAVTVGNGNTLDFQMKQTSGPNDGLHYEGGAAINCPVKFQVGRPPIHIYGAP